MKVIYTYTEQWNFVRSYDGHTEQAALAKIPADFKGYAVVQDEQKTTYHFK